MDLVVSADKKIIVSHEPYMAAATVLTPDGKKISKSAEKTYNFYKMPYDSIRQYKTGILKNAKFRNQKKVEGYKPLLAQVLEQVEAHRKDHDLPRIQYYLEVKSRPGDYGIFQPDPDEFADLLMQVIKDHEIQNEVVVQSFDANFLNAFNKKYPSIKISVLIYRTPWKEKLEKLDFKPYAVGPYFKQLKRKEQVEELHAQGFKVIPWTVNSKRRIRKMIRFGVDGIISDYPEKILQIRQSRRN
jgi:glycerophosphoryl diester phosphodiesterase